MGRPVSFNFTTGGGSPVDFLMGEITAEPTAMHNLGAAVVLPDPVTIALTNGQGSHPDMAISPDGPDPLWCYKFTIKSSTGRTWIEYRGVIEGEGTAVYRFLPKFHTGPNPPELEATVDYLVAQAIATDSTVALAAVEAVGDALEGASVMTGAFPVAANSPATFSITDADGRRSWLEIAADGGPTEHAADLVAGALQEPIQDAVHGVTDAMPIPRPIPYQTPTSFSITDTDGRRSWLEIAEDGGPTEHAVEFIAGALDLTIEPVADYMAAEPIPEITGTTPDRQLWVNDPRTNTRRLLVSTGDPSQARASIDGRAIFYTTETGQWSVPVAGGTPGPIQPTVAISCWGDSITQGTGGDGTTYPAVLATLTGIPVHNGGVGGRSSSDIAILQGGRSPALNVQGGSIPASGPVTITLTEPGSYRVSSTGIWTFSGTLAGVPGKLSHDLDAKTWSFIRTSPGTETAVPDGTRFHSTNGIAHREKIQILWAGRNNVVGNEVILPDVSVDTDLMIDYMTSYAKKYLVLGILNSTNETSGTANYDRVIEQNATMAKDYGPYYYDIRKDFVTRGLAIAGITPTAQDTANMAVDAPPPSLLNDAVHPNAAGYQVIAQLIHEHILTKGWLA